MLGIAKRHLAAAVGLGLGAVAILGEAEAKGLTKEPFGTLADGTAVERYRMTNAGGMEVDVITYGGIVGAIRAPDGDGRLASVVLGFATLEDYATKNPYFGTTTGRYANRIAGGRFILDGKEYRLALNNGPNSLHGGK